MGEVLLVGQVGGTAAVVPPEPSALELEDILYDILASGADPSISASTLEAVQTFLHEHARSKHSHAEFVAFFTKHGLSMVKDNAVTLALPPLEFRAPAPLSVPFHLTPEPDPIEVTPVAAIRKRKLNRTALWAGAAAALAAISCVVYLRVSLLNAELEQVRAQERATAAALDRLHAEIANHRQWLDKNTKQVERVDQKSELLLQTLVSPLDPAQR